MFLTKGLKFVSGKRKNTKKSDSDDSADENTIQCLVLGCAGAGKTLLSRKMKQMSKVWDGSCSVEEMEEPLFGMSTLVTTGMELTKIPYKEKMVHLREVGSPLMLMWPTYFKKCHIVLYIVGTSNLLQISSAWIEFLELLSAEEMRDKKIILVFNKVDLCNALTLATATEVFRLEDIINTSNQHISVAKTSSANGEGILELVEQICSAR